MAFALRYGEKEFPLGQGRFVIGRSEECQLCLDDPLASRNHAALLIGPQEVRVEDLNSRNGVFVNEKRVSGDQALNAGDRVRVGAQEMLLIRRRSSLRAETLVQEPVVSRAESLAVLGGLADKALGMGRADEAVRILGRRLEETLQRAESGDGLTDEECSRVCGYVLRIAVVSRQGKWIDYLFRLHTGLHRLMDGEVVNEIYAIAPKVQGASRKSVRRYLETMQEGETMLSPGERFVLKRLEGLEGLLS